MKWTILLQSRQTKYDFFLGLHCCVGPGIFCFPRGVPSVLYRIRLLNISSWNCGASSAMVSISRKTNRHRNKVPLKRQLSTARMCLPGYVRKKPPLRAANGTCMVSESLVQAGPDQFCLVKREGERKNLSRWFPVPDDNKVSHHD